MNTLVQKVNAWLASKGGFAHVVALTYVGVVAAYAEVPSFAKLLNDIYATMGPHTHEVLLAVLGLVAWYRTNKSGATK